MRERKILPEAGFIELVFLITGHTHNIIDQRHSVIQKQWIHATLFDMNDWLSLINSISGFRAKELIIYNFSEWLAPYVKKNKNLLMINQPHLFRFTRNGIITKQYVTDREFSTWRGRSELDGSCFEPYQILLNVPPGSPQVVSPAIIGMFSLL